MKEITQITKQIESFVNKLIESGQIYDAGGLSVSIRTNSDYRSCFSSTKKVDYKQSFEKPEYDITIFVYVTEKSSSTLLNSNHYDTLDKAFTDIQFRIENEIKLHHSLESLTEKLKSLNTTDDTTLKIANLKIELEDCIKQEKYERANELKKEIKSLETKIKRKKK